MPDRRHNVSPTVDGTRGRNFMSPDEQFRRQERLAAMREREFARRDGIRERLRANSSAHTVQPQLGDIDFEMGRRDRTLVDYD